MLRILRCLSIVFTFHKEQRVKTKWLRTLVKLKILWLQKLGWDAILQLGIKFNNWKKKKKATYSKWKTAWKLYLATETAVLKIHSPHPSIISHCLPFPSGSKTKRFNASSHHIPFTYHEQKFTSLSLISSSLNRNEIIRSRILFPKWHEVVLHHMIQKAVLLRFTLINRHFTSRADKQFQMHFQFSIGDGILTEIYFCRFAK